MTRKMDFSPADLSLIKSGASIYFPSQPESANSSKFAIPHIIYAALSLQLKLQEILKCQNIHIPHNPFRA